MLRQDLSAVEALVDSSVGESTDMEEEHIPYELDGPNFEDVGSDKYNLGNPHLTEENPV